MTTQQQNALKTLQSRWVRHQELRTGGAPVAELAASRAQLDRARLESARVLASVR